MALDEVVVALYKDATNGVFAMMRSGVVDFDAECFCNKGIGFVLPTKLIDVDVAELTQHRIGVVA